MNYSRPYYRYSLPILNQTLIAATEAANQFQFKMHYAIKANNHTRIVQKIKEYGLGVDCVSAEEIEFALLQGWSPTEIVFAGSGKTYFEIQYALEQNVGVIHCESMQEWEIIQEIRANTASKTQIALRINPDLKVETHAKISTGEKHHKFGMGFHEALEIIAIDRSIIGFHFHIGSQILDMQYFESLSLTVRNLLDTLPNNFNLKYLNLGGGLGIDYEQPERNPIPDFEGWMMALRSHLPTSLIPIIHIEPGRSIVGQCGTLVGTVQYLKHLDSQPLAILDVGMNALMRPALYGARHQVTAQSDQLIRVNYTVSGPSCESSDTFGDNFLLPVLKRGDQLIIHSTGAYGASMSLNYNLRRPLESQFIEEEIKTSFKKTENFAEVA
ncbi:MAG: diaminopimelate decarboxylase [Crocinitomicaceae bacterium]|nr:diaminopimelate decarboxylase [Crocinitomicaceae bacterium]